MQKCAELSFGNLNYDLIRSKRKTCSIEIKSDGKVIVRVPYAMPCFLINKFIKEKSDWIRKALIKTEKQKTEAEKFKPLSETEISKLKEKAQEYIPERVEYFAKIIGVTYGKITVRCQKTRWGSCNSKGNLNFNCLLMLTPSSVIDYVIVHELCHRLEMNHSARFWNSVGRIMPDYKKNYNWLKENGKFLIARL